MSLQQVRSDSRSDAIDFGIYENVWNGTSAKNHTNITCVARSNSSALPWCSRQARNSYSYLLGIALISCVAIIMFAMGCTVKMNKLKERFLRPWGISIGFICQFGIMPVCAFGVASLMRLSQAQALVVLIMGCLPGGNASNLIAYWCDGDMDLSIAMTTTSTILAFVMMPLCLFVYSRSFVDEVISLPYVNVCYVLAILIVPVAIGILINYWRPIVAKILVKIGAIIGIIMVSVAGVIGIILYPGAFKIVPIFWIAGSMLPMLGYIFGYVTAFVIDKIGGHRLISDRQKRTIAIETGMQNSQLCSTIIQLNYGCTCTILEMYSYPLVYFLMQVIEALLICCVFQVRKFLCATRRMNRCEDVEMGPCMTSPRSA